MYSAVQCRAVHCVVSCVRNRPPLFGRPRAPAKATSWPLPLAHPPACASRARASDMEGRGRHPSYACHHDRHCIQEYTCAGCRLRLSSDRLWPCILRLLLLLCIHIYVCTIHACMYQPTSRAPRGHTPTPVASRPCGLSHSPRAAHRICARRHINYASPPLALVRATCPSYLYEATTYHSPKYMYLLCCRTGTGGHAR